MEDYHWSTEEPHYDNTQTMNDYLENHLTEKFECYFQDDSYAEIMDLSNDVKWGVHASGNGDSFNHKVRFEFIH